MDQPMRAFAHLQLQLSAQRKGEEGFAGCELLVYERLGHAMTRHCSMRGHSEDDCTLAQDSSLGWAAKASAQGLQ